MVYVPPFLFATLSFFGGGQTSRRYKHVVVQVLLKDYYIILFAHFVGCISKVFLQKIKNGIYFEYNCKHLYFLKSNTKRLFLGVLKPYLQTSDIILLVILLGELFEDLTLFIF